MRWPWDRYRITDAERDDSRRRLQEAKARKAHVAALTDNAEDIIRRNHLGESIHKALTGG